MLDWLNNSKPSYPQDFYNKNTLYVESSPEFVDTSSNINLTCYNSSTKNAVLPCRYTWFRSRNGLTTQITNVCGSAYMCQPADLGATIKVECTSKDDSHPGQTSLQFGPVKLDVLFKKDIEIALKNNKLILPAKILDSNSTEKEIQLILTDQYAQLSDTRSQAAYRFEFGTGYPRIQLNPKDSSKFTIDVQHKNEKALSQFRRLMFPYSRNQPRGGAFEIKLDNRAARDTFLFSLKAFTAKKELRAAYGLNGSENSDASAEIFNYLFEIQSLRLQLSQTIQLNNSLKEEKSKYQLEATRLQVELTTLRNNSNSKYGTFQTNNLGAIEQQNRSMKAQIILLKEELDEASRKLQRMESSKRVQVVQKQSGYPSIKPFEQIMSKSVLQQLKKGRTQLDDNSILQKSKSKIEVQNILESLNNESVAGIKELERLTDSISNLLTENDTLSARVAFEMQKNNELMNMVYMLEENWKKQNRKVKELDAVIKNIEIYFRNQPVQHPQQPVPNVSSGIRVLHNGPFQPVTYTNQPPQLMGLTFNPASLIRQLQAFKTTNQELSKQVAELSKLKTMDTANNQLLQLENSRLKQQVRQQQTRLGQYEKQMIEKLTLNLDLEKRLTEIIKENNQIHKKRAAIEAQTKPSRNENKKLEENLKAATVLLSQKDAHIKQLKHRVSSLDEQLNIKQKDLVAVRDEKTNVDSKDSRYRKKYEELLQENRMLKKGQSMLNKSRDLTMQMDSFIQEEHNVLKEQNNMLLEENAKLMRMIEKSLADARETSKLKTEILHLREENVRLKAEIIRLTENLHNAGIRVEVPVVTQELRKNMQPQQVPVGNLIVNQQGELLDQSPWRKKQQSYYSSTLKTAEEPALAERPKNVQILFEEYRPHAQVCSNLQTKSESAQIVPVQPLATNIPGETIKINGSGASIRILSQQRQAHDRNNYNTVSQPLMLQANATHVSVAQPGSSEPAESHKSQFDYSEYMTNIKAKMQEQSSQIRSNFQTRRVVESQAGAVQTPYRVLGSSTSTITRYILRDGKLELQTNDQNGGERLKTATFGNS